MVGILLSYWGGLFSGAMLVLWSVCVCEFQQTVRCWGCPSESVPAVPERIADSCYTTLRWKEKYPVHPVKLSDLLEGYKIHWFHLWTSRYTSMSYMNMSHDCLRVYHSMYIYIYFWYVYIYTVNLYKYIYATYSHISSLEFSTFWIHGVSTFRFQFNRRRFFQMPMLNPHPYQHRYESEFGCHGLAPSDSLNVESTSFKLSSW